MSPRYQDWLKHVFDHEVKDPCWYFEEDAPKFPAPPAEMVELLSQTFHSSGRDLNLFSDAQVDQGFWYLTGTGWHMDELYNSRVGWDSRVKCVRAIFQLYADCFAKRCTETLGHQSEVGLPLNASCYMFWDQFTMPFRIYPGKHQDMHDVVLETLEHILAIPHRACREGALHGLGHVAGVCPDRVGEIIDRFLGRPKLDASLWAYAVKARTGRVQ